MSTQDDKSAQQTLAGWARAVLISWFIVVLALQSAEFRRDSQQQRVIAELDAKGFDDYLVYYSIIPARSPVQYGAMAFYKSDSAIVSIPKGGLRVEWREWIECDHNPHDTREVFDYYAAVQTTYASYIKKRARPDAEELAARKGYPATAQGTREPVRYPQHDADCRLVSEMTQFHRFGLTKIFKMWSKVVEVRGVIPQAAGS